MAAAADQVAQRAGTELVFGHRHGLVDYERCTSGVSEQMGNQRCLEDGEDLGHAHLELPGAGARTAVGCWVEEVRRA